MCAVLEAVFSVKMPMLLNNSQSYAKALCSHEDVNGVPVSSMCSGIMGQRCHVIMKHMEERRANEPSLASCQHFLDHCLVSYKICVTTFLC